MRYFFVTDKVEKGTVEILYCLTDKVTRHFMTKPLQGSKYFTFKRVIMGLMEKRAIVDNWRWYNDKDD